LGLPDVDSLSALLPATEQQQSGSAAPSIVHTVARAVVNPEFPDTTTDRVCITDIAETYAGKPGTNTGPGLDITQPTYPFLKWDTP
jgi:hypothetical protein